MLDDSSQNCSTPTCVTVLHSFTRVTGTRRSCSLTMTTLVKITTATALAGAGLSYAYYSQQKTESPKPKEFPKHFDPHPFQHLSQQEIDARLRSGQIINKSNAKWVKAIYTNRMASNDPVEDNYSVNTFQGSKLLAGVYDGKVGVKLYISMHSLTR